MGAGTWHVQHPYNLISQVILPKVDLLGLNFTGRKIRPISSFIALFISNCQIRNCNSTKLKKKPMNFAFLVYHFEKDSKIVFLYESKNKP